MSRVHYKRRRRVKARPYSEQDMAQIWTLLGERGTTQAKLIIAAGEDFGPRRIDICYIQRADIDFRQKLIRLVNSKSKLVGYVPFGPKTEHWLRACLRSMVLLRRGYPESHMRPHFRCGNRGGWSQEGRIQAM